MHLPGGLHVFISALIAALLSLFSGHSAAVHPQAQAAAAVETQTTQQLPADPFNSPATSTPASSTSEEAASVPIVEQVIEEEPAAPSDLSGYVTQDELAAQLNDLSDSLLAKFSAQPQSSPTSSVPEYIAADGNPANPYAAENAINNLSNVTISNPTISGGNITATAFSGTMPIGSGGTGISNTPAYGQLLLGNGTNYTLTATSSLGFPQFSDLSSQIAAAYEFPGDATSTTLAFASGLLSAASTTIGDGNQNGGLTVSGGATTTGAAYFGGALTLNGATTTAADGFNIASGCFSINGVCVGAGSGSGSSSVSTSSANSWTGLQTLANSTTTLATISNLWLPNVTTNSLLKVNANGQVAAAVAGTDYQAPITGTQGQVVYFSGTNTAAGTSTLFISPSRSVGIGTSTPWASFSVQAISGQTNPLFLVASTTGATTTTSLAVAASGNVGIGTTTPFDLLDVQGLATPLEASTTSSGLSGPRSVTVSGRYAYVASNSNSSLVVFDVSNPASPVEVGSSTSGLSNPDSVTVSGRYAYVASASNNALVIFDISNPASPVEVGSSTSGLSSPYSVTVSGRYAYVASLFNNALVIFDISNPASPVEVGSSTSGLSSPYSVTVSGRYAYVADHSNGLVIFDISNPASPVKVGSSTSGLSSPESVTVSGRYAYVASYSNNSLVVFDVSNPASPVKVGSATSGLANPYSVTVSGRYAYVASYSNSSLVVFDVSNPASPVKVGSATSGLANPYSVTVSGRYAYVASNGNSSLVTFQIGGEYTQSLEAGTLQAGSLSLDNNLQALDGAFSEGLTVGNNAAINGSLSVTASTFNAAAAASSTYSIFSVNTASSTNPLFTTLYNGNVGVGTSTPSSRLTIWGSDTASTSAFAVVNSASTTIFSVFDNGNATYAGSIFQSSDQRLKTDVTSLDASDSLAAIESLNPVSYLRLDQPGTGENLGFIAQQVQQVFPELVSTTSPTSLTPGGTLTLNYEGLIAPVVKAVQSIANITDEFEQNLIAWLGDAQNGIADLFAQNIHAQNELCVGSTCVTPAQFEAMVAAVGYSGAGSGGSGGAGAAADSSDDSSSTPPVISINGDNPAIIQVGDAYSDLGATITGPEQDLNLGITTYVNGSPMSPVQIDTTAEATDTIDYVVTDQSGLASTSTRTVIVEAQESDSPFTDLNYGSDASSSDATSTQQ